MNMKKEHTWECVVDVCVCVCVCMELLFSAGVMLMWNDVYRENIFITICFFIFCEYYLSASARATRD